MYQIVTVVFVAIIGVSAGQAGRTRWSYFSNVFLAYWIAFHIYTTEECNAVNCPPSRYCSNITNEPATCCDIHKYLECSRFMEFSFSRCRCKDPHQTWSTAHQKCVEHTGCEYIRIYVNFSQSEFFRRILYIKFNLQVTMIRNRLIAS